MAIVLNQKVKIRWGTANKSHLVSKGYSFTKLRDEIEIDVKDLTEGSPQKVKFICDFCNNEYSYRFSSIRRRNQFCSKKCLGAWNSLFPRTQIATSCGYCEKEVITVPSKLKKSTSGMVFCSNECVGKYNKIRLAENRVHKTCLICNEEYDVKPNEAPTSVTCSRVCQGKWQSKYLIGEEANNFNKKYSLKERMHNCDWCGKEYKLKNIPKVEKKGSKDSPYFCSKQCYREWYANDWSQRKEWREESRNRAVQMISDGLFPKTNTSIQKEVESILVDMDIEFISEYNCRHYAVDLYLPKENLFIELNGGYWHCDPRKYNIIEYKTQLGRIIADKRKRTFVEREFNSKILYLWEDDIKNNKDLIRNIISQFVAENGHIKNYQSFNYELINKTLKVKEDVIIPFMDKDIDFLNSIFIPKDTSQIVSRKQVDKWITFNCDECGQENEQLKSRYVKAKNHFCSLSCGAKFRGRSKTN